MLRSDLGANVPFTISNMEIPRLATTISERLRVDDPSMPPGGPVSLAAVSGGSAAWDQALAAQCAAQPSASVPGASASEIINPSGLTNFKMQSMQAQVGRESSALPPSLQPTFAARLSVGSAMEKAGLSSATVESIAQESTAGPTSTPVAVATTDANAVDGSKLLPLDQIAKQDDLLNRADVHVDPKTKLWSAEWPSPSPFHYGMVLKPTLAKFIKDGQSFSFQNGSDQVETISNKGGQIFVGQSGSETELDSLGLKHLLQNKIKSSGYELYLTQRGSLVLSTKTAPVLTMAQ
jgi:hypothetical protein